MLPCHLRADPQVIYYVSNLAVSFELFREFHSQVMDGDGTDRWTAEVQSIFLHHYLKYAIVIGPTRVT